MTSCFRFEACDVCPRCGKRPGVVCGLQGFGVRLKGHEARCARRLPDKGLPGNDSLCQTDNFVSTSSRLPQDAQIRTSAATTAWFSAVSRPSDQTDITITRDSSISRASTQTPNQRSSSATSKQSDVFDDKDIATLADVQKMIRAALYQKLASGELLGVLDVEPEIARVQVKLREAFDEALSSGQLAVALGIGDIDREKHSDQTVFWPTSVHLNDRVCLETDDGKRWEKSETKAEVSTSNRKKCAAALLKGMKNGEVAKLVDAMEANGDQKVSSISKGDVATLSQDERNEAVLIYELCDKEGQDNAALEDLVDVAVKQQDVAHFLGFQVTEHLTVESVREQILAKVGRVQGITWQNFELFVSEQRANVAEQSSTLPRLSAEKEIDLIFDMCDVDKNGSINFAEFAAFCVKRPRIAELVGMRDNHKRRQADVLFAQLSDGTGSITRKGLRNFVWQRRGGTTEPEKSRSENSNENEVSPVLEKMEKQEN